MAKGWLRDLLDTFFPGDAGIYREVDVPPIRILPLGPLQLIDTRALTDPDLMLSMGLRVGVEMVRTLPSPMQRAWFFAPAVTDRLLRDEGFRWKEIHDALAAKMPMGSEIGLLVEPNRLDEAVAACAGLGLFPIPCRGPGSNEIEERIGAPPARGYVIAHPKIAPDLCHIAGVPGVGIFMKNELILDLRRTSVTKYRVDAVHPDPFQNRRPNELDLGTPLVAADLAIRKLPQPKRRTWIVADWMIHDETLRQTARIASGIIETKRPAMDQLAVDGDLTSGLRDWASDLGLKVAEAPIELTEGLALPYPQVAQNIMIAYAVFGK